MIPRWLCLSTFLMLGPVANAFAEDAPQASPLNLPSGVRARVVSSSGILRGFLVQSDATALRIAPEGGGTLKTVPVDSIARLELAFEEKRNTLKGTVIGALVLGVVMGVGGTVDPHTCNSPSSSTFCSRGEAVAGSVLVGAGLGALVGHFVKTEHFTPIDVNALRPTPTTRQSRAGLAFGVTFRF